MTDQRKKEFSLRITQANKTELIVILYEMYLDYLGEAENAAQDKRAFREAIRKARNCLNELMNSLNFDYDTAYHLFQLYLYVSREMTSADVCADVKPLKNCRMVIEELLTAYREVSRQDTSGPVMENTQTVYAGLTYGKGKLTESLAYQGNRGLLA